MTAQHESIHDIGTRLHELAATLEANGVSAATASALENVSEGTHAIAVSMRAELKKAEQAVSAE